MPRTLSFLQAIQEDPQEDTRLIFADWLEEQSDPALSLRGEFLRLQCRLSAWIADLKERTAAWARQQQLLERQAAWLGPLQGHVTEVRWQRGLAQVAIPARRFCSERWAGHWPELFRQAWVEGLRLEQPTTVPLLEGIAANAGLAEVGRLDLSGCGLGDDSLQVLLRSPHLSRLSVLDLSNNRLTDPAAKALFQSAGRLPCLKFLDLRNNGMTQQGVRLLVQGPLGKQLRRLELMGNRLNQPFPELAQGQASGTARWPRMLGNSIGMEFTLIPAGTFLMGSPENETGIKPDERPQREVTISRPFYLGVFAVTQQQYQRVVEVNPSHFTAERGGRPTFPVENVSWEDAEAFCRQLTRLAEERQRGHVYRLPTEAEWEYAARSGTPSDWPSYLGPSLSSHQANFNGAFPYNGGKSGPYRQQPLPVGSFPPSPWGLFDIHGNVWEWCRDWHGDRYYEESPAIDPVGPERGERRVLRGGSWLNHGVNCRAAARDRYSADFRYYDNGLRVVLEVGNAS